MMLQIIAFSLKKITDSSFPLLIFPFSIWCFIILSIQITLKNIDSSKVTEDAGRHRCYQSVDLFLLILQLLSLCANFSTDFLDIVANDHGDGQERNDQDDESYITCA